jgi:hypothetical protein
MAGQPPTRFERQGLFRFDAPGGEFKTYYFGCTPAAAFLETLGGIRPLPQHLVNERVITELSPGSSIMAIADFTDYRVLADFDLHFDPYIGDYVRVDMDRPSLPYTFTQRLAVSLWRSGFQGIQYFTSHQPRAEEVSIALFAPKDFHDLDIKARDPEPIGKKFLSGMQRHFGVEVLPADPLPW